MKVLQGEGSQEVILEFADQQEFEAFFDLADRNGSFDIRSELLPSEVVFRARALGSTRSRRIRPLSVRKDRDFYQIRISEQTELSSREPAVKSPEGGDQSEQPQSPRQDSEAQSQEEPQNLRDRIRAIPMTERAIFAMRADNQERRVLMQENNIKINEFLLRNPRISEKEIAWIAANPGSPMATLLAISNHREWMSKESIRLAILTNPKTPAAFLIEKLPYLSGSDLIKMRHARLLREDIQAAVRREMSRRGIAGRS